MEKSNSSNEVTLTGTVVPSEWDDDDNVIAVAISTDDEDYVVERNRLGAELFDFLDENVEVRGILKKGMSGGKGVSVIDYEVLGSNSDFGEYEENLYTEDGESLIKTA